MKVTIEADITDCRDCWFKKFHYGQGECWVECSHPEHNQGPYDNKLWGCSGDFESIPQWCPLGLAKTKIDK